WISPHASRNRGRSRLSEPPQFSQDADVVPAGRRVARWQASHHASTPPPRAPIAPPAPQRSQRTVQRGLLDSTEASGARAALDVQLLQVLDADPKVVLGLAALDERAREAGGPAVEIASQPVTLSADVTGHEIELRGILERPSGTELVAPDQVQRL